MEWIIIIISSRFHPSLPSWPEKVAIPMHDPFLI